MRTVVKLPHQFKARAYQSELLRAIFIEKYKNIYWIVHRRAGKTKTAVNILSMFSTLDIGSYYYLLPQRNQAKRVIWKGMDGAGMRFMDHFPNTIINKINNTDMSIEVKNGSIIYLLGSNNYDALMGTNPKLIIYDEYALQNPMARQYLSPILTENKGVEILLGTPRGRNHGHQAYINAIDNPNWFVRKLTVDDTKKEDGSPVITLEDIEKERRNGLSDEMIRQEFYCDFSVGNIGAYFTEEMDRAEYEGRLKPFEINNRLPVFTSWDLGVSDPTCITFFQQDGPYINIIYYLEKTDKVVDYYARQLQEIANRFGLRYKYHFAPHDISKREWGSSARSSLSLAHEAGIHFLRVPDVGVDNGIQALRAIFPQLRIHGSYCLPLIDALRDYRREWDEENRVFKSSPFHNWASHPVDSVRYLAVVWRDSFTRPDMNQPRKYQSAFS
jgi:hypothetical protein